MVPSGVRDRAGTGADWGTLESTLTTANRRLPLRVVEIFLPVTYGDGSPIPAEIFEVLKQELAEKFGGVTVYSRSPAEGLWQKGGQKEREAIVIFEVMTDRVEKDWWSEFRGRLEALLRQEEVRIRSKRAARL